MVRLEYMFEVRGKVSMNGFCGFFQKRIELGGSLLFLFVLLAR